ncbi:MAG TPA: hypothetical protein PLM85_09570 [Nitrosomonas sp.]|nr:hypothetical protein [Nitrosomonas sp.]HNJ38554.1 hypothetical protein [Nitrosomonas sp.]
MSWTTTINGVSYAAPDVGELFWGTQVKNWMQAVGGTGSGQGGMLKKDGGLFQLLAEVNFGTAFGIKAITYTSGSANSGSAAGAGQIRLKRADLVEWRNNADSGNLTLGVSTSNWLQWQSIDLADISSVQTLTNKSISGLNNTISNIALSSIVAPAAGVLYSDGASILSETRLSLSRMATGTQYYVLTGNGASSPSYALITNNSVDASAAIARTKLASGTASHVLINDGSGVMSSEARLSLSRTADGTNNYVLIAAGAGVSPAYGLITNSNLDAAAAIARTKIAAGSANHVIINDGAGNLSSEAQLSVSRGGTGLSAVGTSNQVLGVNNAGNANEYKTLSVGTSGTDFAIAHSAGSVVFNLPDSSAANRGALTSTDWTTFNNKIGGSGTNGQVALFNAGSTITSNAAIAYSTSANSNTLSLLSGIKIGTNTTVAGTAGAGAIRYNSGTLEFSDGAAWNTLGVVGAGIVSLNALTATTQTFAVGTAGTDFAISSATSTHTFNLPDAGASARGVVTTGTQTFAGDKTFSGNTVLNGTVTLGDATTDDVTFNGYVASAILPKTSGSYSLGSTAQNWDALYLDKGATNSGSIYFDAGTTKYIQGNAAGTILTIGGFTSMVPPAAINAAGALTIGTNGSTTALTLSTAQAATFASSVTTSSYYYTKGDGSDTAGSSNTGILFSNTAANRYITQQLDASNNLLIGRYNGSAWATIVKLNQDQSILPIGLLDLSTSTAGQIKFPASQNASADANTLDDYEEGTWSPGFKCGSTAASLSVTVGTYIKIGKTVYVSGTLTVSNLNGGSGNLVISNLPFSSQTTSGISGYLGITYAGNMSSFTGARGFIEINNTIASIYLDNATTYTAATQANATATTQLYFSGFYYSAS